MLEIRQTSLVYIYTHVLMIEKSFVVFLSGLSMQVFLSNIRVRKFRVRCELRQLGFHVMTRLVALREVPTSIVARSSHSHGLLIGQRHLDANATPMPRQSPYLLIYSSLLLISATPKERKQKHIKENKKQRKLYPFDSSISPYFSLIFFIF